MDKTTWKTEWNKTHTQWQKENTMYVGLRLFKTTDSDIIKALDGKRQKGTEIKRLIRIGLANDIHSDIHTDEIEQE